MHERMYGYLYRPFNPYGETVCTYCSAYADTIDHVLPICHTAHLKETGIEPPKDLLLLVPSCKECNSLLGPKVFKSLKAKKAFLLKRYRQRYSAILNQPELEDDDYGPSLLAMLKTLESKRQNIMDRVSFLQISI